MVVMQSNRNEQVPLVLCFREGHHNPKRGKEVLRYLKWKNAILMKTNGNKNAPVN
jgi:uncharacterized protein YjhX (UPF0386 family)